MASLLITGAAGSLGLILSPMLESRFAVTRVVRREGPGGRHCDLTDSAAARQLLKSVRPDIIVHLAALVDVDACERSPAAAYAVNARATQTIAEWILAESPETRLLYVSTDQIYDAPGPSREENVSPSNVYALTKLWGEDHVRCVERHTVLRVNFFAGKTATGKGLVPWLVEKSRASTPVLLFSDVLFNPLHVAHLAGMIVEAIDREIFGTLNIGASGSGMSKAEFLRSAARRLGLPHGNFKDGSVADAGLVAYRPRDMRMDVSKAERAFGRTLPTIDEGLNLVAAEYDRSAA